MRLDRVHYDPFEGDANARDVYLIRHGATALNARNHSTARALVSIMQEAGVDFGILGEDEACTGDSARRMGNEIGSHYVSHICDESNTWTADDWVSEQSQWERLMLNVNEVNKLKTPISSIITLALPLLS